MDAERARLNAVLRQMPAGIIIADAPSGRLISGNEQVEKILRQPFIACKDLAAWKAYTGFHADGRPYAPEEWPLARTRYTEYYLHTDGGLDTALPQPSEPTRYAFDPSDRGATHAFDGHVRNAIKGATRTPKPIVRRIDSFRERSSAAEATIASLSTVPHREPPVANDFCRTLGPAVPACVLWTILGHDSSSPEVDTR